MGPGASPVSGVLHFGAKRQRSLSKLGGRVGWEEEQGNNYNLKKKKKLQLAIKSHESSKGPKTMTEVAISSWSDESEISGST